MTESPLMLLREIGLHSLKSRFFAGIFQHTKQLLNTYLILFDSHLSTVPSKRRLITVALTANNTVLKNNKYISSVSHYHFGEFRPHLWAKQLKSF